MSRDRTPTFIASQLCQSLAVLDAFGVRTVILDKQRDSVLLNLVRSRPDWAIDFEDGEAALFIRVPQPETA